MSNYSHPEGWEWFLLKPDDLGDLSVGSDLTQIPQNVYPRLPPQTFIFIFASQSIGPTLRGDVTYSFQPVISMLSWSETTPDFRP